MVGFKKGLMAEHTGVFIVLEGTDGSGKGTQSRLLVDTLRAKGYQVAYFDFPQYDQPSSYFVKQYLAGAYGGTNDIDPYTGSLFYALDRYESAIQIRQALADGKVVIANRFTGSNMAHQGTKFKNPEERRGYFIWLDNLEFQMLGIPRPDKSFVLRVPIEVTQALNSSKNHDIHESDNTHIEQSINVYDDLCILFPKDFQRIDCVRGQKLLSVDTIHAMLWNSIEPLLPEPGKVPLHTPTPSYFTPTTLDDTTRSLYMDAMDQLVKSFQIISGAAAKVGKEELALVQAILPAATNTRSQQMFPNTHKLVGTSLPIPAHGAAAVNMAKLIAYSPKNELTLLNDILYQSSTLSQQEITAAIDKLTYQEKADALLGALGRQTVDIPGGSYTWDIVSDVGSFLHLTTQLPSTAVTPQIVSPRLGYEVPDFIEELGLLDTFEACFDLSLKLHSALQAAGYQQEAQLATLLGHRMRWKVTLSVAQTRQLLSQPASDKAFPSTAELLAQIKTKLAETHPLVTQF